MPGVTHDFFVRHAVAIGGRHEARAEAMWAERFRQRASQAGLRRTLEKDLAHRIRAQPGAFNHASTVDFAEERTSGDFRQLQPSFQGRDWAGVVCPSTGYGNLCALPMRVRLGTLDEQLQPVGGPGHVFHIQPDELGAAQSAGEAQQKQRPVTGDLPPFWWTRVTAYAAAASCSFCIGVM